MFSYLLSKNTAIKMEDFSVDQIVQDYVDNVNAIFENYYNDNLEYQENLYRFLPYVNHHIAECRRQILNYKKWAATFEKIYERGYDEDEIQKTYTQIEIAERELDYLLQLRLEIFRQYNSVRETEEDKFGHR